jgi:Tol biopolymer transport system component
LGFALAAAALIVTAVATRRLPVRTLATWAGVGLLIAVPFTPKLLETYRNSLGSDHFPVEVDARLELNHLAGDMILDRPLLGVGLNNFQRTMGEYDRYGLIFSASDGLVGHPVHNVFLLHLAETGLVGFAGLAMIGLSLFVVAVRLARATDPLYAGVGAGVAAIFLFFLVEEQLVFSLRQEHTLALFWILAGLSVACLRLSGWRPAPGRPRPAAGMRGGGRRRPVAAAAALAMISTAFTTSGSEPAAPPETSNLKILFSAAERPGERHALYTVNGDGTGLQRLSPDDGLDYNWPTWAMGGTKVAFTARSGDGVHDDVEEIVGGGGAVNDGDGESDGGSSASGLPETVYLMDADGAHRTPLTFEPWTSGQPKVSPDGRSLVFTAFWAEFPLIALYRLDLDTLQVTNLSAAAGRITVDADPRWSADGSLIAFATSYSDNGTVPTQIEAMHPDGSGRRALTHDSFYNLDPALSPNGRRLAVSSYRGEGLPQDPEHKTRTRSSQFHLVVSDVDSGAERVLTAGRSCADVDRTCSPEEASAYAPVWTPSGDGVGFVAALNATTTCICVMSPDGSHARAVFSSETLAISWFDWVVPGPAPATAVTRIGGQVPAGRLVFSGTDLDGKPVLAVSDPDRYGSRRIPVPAGLSDVSNPRLTPDGRQVVFTARSAGAIGQGTPHPSPPPGVERSVHFILDFLWPLLNDSAPDEMAGAEQVYRMDLDGRNVERLTDPWLEDYMDAMADGEARGNGDADLSPDGRWLVFRNQSSTTDESFILRLDMRSGEVFSLTNATAGAFPTHDRSPRFSSDGSRVVFSGSVGANPQIMVVDAADGLGLRQLTDDEYLNIFPAWSPDGSEIVYSSYRGSGDADQADLEAVRTGGLPLHDWYLVKIDVSTGQQTVLTSPLDSPVFRPTWSPDGRSIVFVSLGRPAQPDLFSVPAGGGPVRPVQVTVRTHETSVDWR